MGHLPKLAKWFVFALMYGVLGGIFISLLLGYRPPVWEIALWPPITALWVYTASLWMRIAEMRQKQARDWESMARENRAARLASLYQNYPVIIPGDVDDDG